MENKEIYLDNASTTKPSQEALDAMVKAVSEYANPSSLHGAGFRVEKLIDGARETIASKLGVDKKYIYFTSGGTEANNLALIGTARALKRRGKRIIVSAIEHPSVLDTAKFLKNEGFDVQYAPVTSSGILDITKFKELVTEDTILVSVMHVNNETGVIEPIKEISQIVKSVAPNCVIHSDCVQSYGKIDVKPEAMGVDMISISAHKIHGFKGTGALYSKNNHILPILHGGEQQNEIRPGTENVGGILAFEAATKSIRLDYENMIRKRNILRDALMDKVENIQINGSCDSNSGSVLNVSFIGIKAEILLHSLERYDIFVSTGSACSSHKPQPSHVLTAMGASKDSIAGAIRFSFSNYTTDEELIFAADKIAAEVKTIRRYM